MRQFSGAQVLAFLLVLGQSASAARPRASTAQGSEAAVAAAASEATLPPAADAAPDAAAPAATRATADASAPSATVAAPAEGVTQPDAGMPAADSAAAKVDGGGSERTRPRLAGSVIEEVFARQFYAPSLLNPANQLDVPTGFQRFGTKLRGTYNIGSRFRMVGDTYLQFRTQLHQRGDPDLVTAAYILQLNAIFFINDNVSVRLGKHLGNIGTSLSEQPLIPYRVYTNRRQDEGVNVIDDEGYWGAIIDFVFSDFALHLDYIPAYSGISSSELTNVNQVQAAQAVFSASLFGIDTRVQIFDELNAFKPFVAVAASYAPQALPRLTLSVDTAIVNHKDQVTLASGASPLVNLQVQPRAMRAFSPVLAGVGYAFTDWFRLKFEYLYDGYSFSSAERRALFDDLRAEPGQAPIVASMWRTNLLSRHYWLASLLMPGVWDEVDFFVGYKQSLTDSGARLVGSVGMPIGEVARLELEYFRFLFGSSNSEYRNDFLEQQVGLKAAFFF